MKLIWIQFTKDYKKPNGKTIPAGRKSRMTEEAAQEYIKAKVAQPINVPKATQTKTEEEENKN